MKRITLLFSLLLLPGIAVAQISDSDFDAAMVKYLENDASVAKVGDALERYFQNKREEQARTQEEAEQKELEAQFENPVKVEIGSSPVKGPDTAKITIIEFSDFQCPFCSKADETIKEVVAAYPDNVKLVFKNLPLPFHNEAEPAAVAALAAGEQGKFWEMHDKLFSNQEGLGTATYLAYAKELGLDVDKFTKDLTNERLKKQVKDDAELAGTLGVRGTPGFFVNGVQVRGARPFPYFKQIIDRLLAKK